MTVTYVDGDGRADRVDRPWRRKLQPKQTKRPSRVLRPPMRAVCPRRRLSSPFGFPLVSSSMHIATEIHVLACTNISVCVYNACSIYIKYTSYTVRVYVYIHCINDIESFMQVERMDELMNESLSE